VKVTDAVVVPVAVALTAVGAPGVVSAVTVELAVPAPFGVAAELTARICTAYAVPATKSVVPSVLKSVITIGDAVVPESVRSRQVAPPSVEYWYLIIADPPFNAGAVKGTDICRLPITIDPIVGVPGAIAATVTVGSERTVLSAPTPFVAVTDVRK
jgi:hypothetical protein